MLSTPKSEEKVLQYLIRQKLAGNSLRAIARTYGQKITHGDIARALKGQFPKSPCKRLAFGLPALAPAPVCVKCGEVHTTKRCTNQPKRYRRLDDIPVDVLRWMLTNREEIT